MKTGIRRYRCLDCNTINEFSEEEYLKTRTKWMISGKCKNCQSRNLFGITRGLQ